jgi:superoxide dismutase, Cu-Zn family
MQMMIPASVGTALLFLTTGPTPAAAQHEDHAPAGPARAVAVLVPTAGGAASGTVTFTLVDGGVRVTAHVEGLAAGDHGFHVHEFGDCSAPDATSAGGHFNPGGAPHAGPDATARHVGDLGNLTADTQGMASYDRVDPAIRLDGPHGVIGRAVIVHAAPDDLATQPTGGAGARLACGVIGVAR